MTAPPTPKLGPGSVGGTPKLGPGSVGGTPKLGPSRGSVGGGPWQLVEVPKQQLPEHGPTQQTTTDLAAVEWGFASSGLSDGDPGGDGQVPNSTQGGFDPAHFVGDWLDNLGHRILVAPVEKRGSARGRGGKGGRLAFSAALQKPGVPDKHFTISKDRAKREWTCGNGVLVREESGIDGLSWRAEDGRVSSWTRTPPDGPVYFDAPPEASPSEEPLYFNAGQSGPDGSIYFDAPPGTAEEYDKFGEYDNGVIGAWIPMQSMEESENPVYYMSMLPEGTDGLPFSSEWEGFQMPVDSQEQDETGIGDVVQGAPPNDIIANDETGAPEVSSSNEFSWNIAAPEFGWNVAAPEFKPAMPGPLASTPSPKLTPPAQRASPTLGPIQRPSPKFSHAPPSVSSSSQRPNWTRTPTPSPKLRPYPTPVQIPAPLRKPALSTDELFFLSEESTDVQISGSRLEWRLPDTWGKLSKFPKDFCITSPMFGVQQGANMQLAFYPNGSRTAEPDHCTVSLTRALDSVGIKFEFTVNGRGIGPKVCLGKRYFGDYPKPYNDPEGNKSQQVVVVCMKVLEILGAVNK